MIGLRRPGWFEERDATLLRRIALAPLVPLSWVYGLFALAARRLRTPRFRPATRLSCRVVSVGNLGVGGAGKTPAAAWIASQLRARGHKVALASRMPGSYGELVRVHVPELAFERPVRLVYRQGASASHAADAFLAVAEAHANRAKGRYAFTRE